MKASIAPKLPPGLNWHRKRDGAEVTHWTLYRKFKIEVANYPGSRSLMWRVTDSYFEDNWHDEDRFEYTVGLLKERACQKVDEILAARAARFNAIEQILNPYPNEKS